MEKLASREQKLYRKGIVQMNNIPAHEARPFVDSDRTIFSRNCPTNWPMRRLRANRSERHCLTTIRGLVILQILPFNPFTGDLARICSLSSCDTLVKIRFRKLFKFVPADTSASRSVNYFARLENKRTSVFIRSKVQIAIARVSFHKEKQRR